MKINPYIKNKKRLLNDFRRTTARIRPILVSRYGDRRANIMTEEAAMEYEALIPILPYVGGKQPFTQFIISTGWYLANYRVLQRQGASVEEAGRLIYLSTEAFLKTVPGFARRLLGRRSFSKQYLNRLKKGALKTQQRKYPGNYVFTFVEGDGETFDYGVDYSECGPCKFLKSQGAFELAPYICATDQLTSDMLGWGLKRTMTLAEGYEKCDFRFRKGGKTEISLPAALLVPWNDSSLGKKA